MRRWNTKQVSVLPKVTRVHQNQNLHTEIKETLLENIQIVSVPISALLLTICSFWVHPPTPPLLPQMSHWCKTGQGALEDSSEESCLEVAYLVMEVAARMRWKKCPVPLSGNPAGVTDPSGSSWGPALSVATWCLQGRLCNLVPSAYRGRAVRSAENTNLRSRSVGLSPTTTNSPLPFQSMLLDHDLELP